MSQFLDTKINLNMYCTYELLAYMQQGAKKATFML